MAAAHYTDLTSEVASKIQRGEIGVIRTDTIYGVVARADSPEAVERVYAAKGRTPTKSPIVLIASTNQLFDSYDETTYEYLHEHWPGPISIILPSTAAPDWLQRGNDSVAYRLPADDTLRQFLGLSGPLIAPSANPEGLTPASTIEEAVAYFGDTVDFYVDSGTVDINTPPSQLWRYDPVTQSSERLR